MVNRNSQLEFELGGVRTWAHFLVTVRNNALMCGFFHRSRTKVKAVGQSFNSGLKILNVYRRKGWYPQLKADIAAESKWKGFISSQDLRRDHYAYCVMVSGEIGDKYLVTSESSAVEDFYEYLMMRYKLPLLREWAEPIMREYIKQRTLIESPVTIDVVGEQGGEVEITLGQKKIEISELKVYRWSDIPSEETFEQTVSNLLKAGVIRVCEEEIPPLGVSNLDDYFRKFGSKVVENLEAGMEPLVGLKANVETLALKEKSLFPQQAGVVNGIIAMEEAGKSYAIQNEGMGVGKTIQSLSACEGIAVKKWLSRNPGRTVRDAYMDENAVNYRVVVMAPGHLVSKWRDEIEAEIPFAKAEVITSLSQLVALRGRKKPSGKEFLVMSKDFAKLDTQLSPIPTQIKKRSAALGICSDCKEEGVIRFKKGAGSDKPCTFCGGRKFEPYSLDYMGRYRGMVCPHCGELLLAYKGYDPESPDFQENLAESVLTPAKFDSIRTSNSKCYHCGGALWGSNAKPLVSGGGVEKVPKWYKIRHYQNFAKKSLKTAFVLRGHESEYKATCVTAEGWSESGSPYGPRKVAPVQYIKKYLDGYFDFCILDECHKYMGDSAQGRAAHILSKVSKFTLLLTGTISNGKADCFYNLFWMVDPKKMLAEGYSYSSAERSRFCKEYGCSESTYEADGFDDTTKNLSSRGRKLGQTVIKPGISPVLVGKYMTDCCLYLDISDLSKYLPPLREKVEIVEAPSELMCSYNHVIETLKEASKRGAGRGVLSNMLQFGLSYLDKPYGREPVMNPYMKDSLICRIPDYPEWAEPGRLLPKEERLIGIVKEQIAQNRNVFVYATFTGKAESNISYRLQDIIERYCNLRGKVEIIQSTSPPAKEREAYFHQKASEGIRVFITNPMNVETGLDFCFKHEGRLYNYPTLIFYQMGFSLATLWQASRRHYRLNQTEECLTYYLAYEGTLQTAALAIMAKKQQATAAIQGCFSADGLSAMAHGVDMRTQLAQALSAGDMGDRHDISSMFDALAARENPEDISSSYRPSPTYWELVGIDKYNAESDVLFSAFEAETDSCELFDEVSDGFFDDGFFAEISEIFGVFAEIEAVSVSEPKSKKTRAKKQSSFNQVSLFDLVG